VTKPSLAELAPATFLLWRFGFAAVVLLAVSARRVRALSRADRWRDVVLGGLLAAGFLLQTTGLQVTAAGSRASSPGGSFTTGALLTLAGAAGHITTLSAWATPTNAVGVTTASVGVAAGVCGARSLLAVLQTSGAWVAVLWVALVATCLVLAVQAWAQGALTATSAAVIMTGRRVAALAHPDLPSPSPRRRAVRRTTPPATTARPPRPR